MADKALFTVGVFAGILRLPNEILLRRRVEEGSIIPDQSFKGNWELPGGTVMNQEKISYTHLSRELEREILEELGVTIMVDPMPCFFPAPFKGPKGLDLALATPVFPKGLLNPKGEFMWASVEVLNQLARDFIAPKKDPYVAAQGLLSGWGKRMHCMALSVMGSCNLTLECTLQARETLNEIQKAW